MVKGTLVFEFSSALDLENQLRAYLKLPKLVEITLGQLDAPSNTDPVDTPKPVEPVPEKPAEKPVETLPEPAPLPPVPNTSDVSASEMTLETLAAADHKALVTFVDAHPEVGVTLTEFQRGNNIWRDFIAQKIKNWLETK